MSLAVICTLLFSVCDVQALPNIRSKEISLFDASIAFAPQEDSSDFTAEILTDGLVRLTWPRDPSASSYIVMVNGKFSTNLPASELSTVVDTLGSSAANGKFSVDTVDALNVRTEWVSQPSMILPVTTEVVDEPVDEIPQPEDPTPIDEAPVIEDPTFTEELPVVEEPTPPQDVPAVEEPAPIEVVDTTEEVSPIALVNLAPEITDTSYNCDPVVESLIFNVGQTDYFTLFVTDESPLTLTYRAESSKQGVLDITVDEDGVFAVSALQVGDTFLWLSAKDEAGLVDEYELRVLVQ